MNLIKVEIDENWEQVVIGRELHEFLEVGTPYDKWFPRMCEYGFSEGLDFSTFLSESTGGRPSTNHKLTIAMSKELAMLARNEQGKKARRYFIQVETAWNSPEQIMARALQLAQKTINSFQLQIQEMQPKVEAYNILLTANNSQDVGEVAKSFGIGRNKLFKLLRDKKFLMKNNNPYQKYIENGLFEVIEVNKTSGEWSQNFTKTMITAKGIDKIREIIQEVI